MGLGAGTGSGVGVGSGGGAGTGAGAGVGAGAGAGAHAPRTSKVATSKVPKIISVLLIVLSPFLLLLYCLSGTLFDNHGQDKRPGSLLAAFPGSAVFHRYGACPFLESLESPYFLARGPGRRWRLGSGYD